MTERSGGAARNLPLPTLVVAPRALDGGRPATSLRTAPWAEDSAGENFLKTLMP
jgi:hypothetical protein